MRVFAERTTQKLKEPYWLIGTGNHKDRQNMPTVVPTQYYCVLRIAYCVMGNI